MNISYLSSEKLVLSSYGSGYAIGGAPDELERLANILVNYDDSAPRFDENGDYNTTSRRHSQVHKTHEQFGYLIVSEADLIRAFTILRELENWGQVPSDSAKIQLAESYSHRFIESIPRENFMGWQTLRNNAFAGAVDVERVAAGQSCDGDTDWLDDAVLSGVSRAQSETVVSHK